MNRNLPFWKLKREARRLFSLALATPAIAVEQAAATRYHDRVLAKNATVTEGFLVKTNRVAIYVIFPRDALLDSHLLALRWLQRHGVSPIVVSNLPLTRHEVDRLKPHAFKILQRSNFGLDFGGYRDGVRLVRNRLVDLEQLILMNDSCWFPLPGSQDWLEQVSQLGFDFTSAASHYAVKANAANDFLSQSWRYATNKREFHYTSYAIAIGPRLLRDPDFLSFWSSYCLTNSKKRTVRRGEIGLTHWVLSRGYTHGCTLPLATLQEDLSGLTTDRLKRLARTVIAFSSEELIRLKTSLMSSPSVIEREVLLRFLLNAAARQGISYSLPLYTIGEHGFGFLKKSPIGLSEEAKRISLEITGQLVGEGADIIHREAKDITHRRRKGLIGLQARAQELAGP